MLLIMSNATKTTTFTTDILIKADGSSVKTSTTYEYHVTFHGDDTDAFLHLMRAGRRDVCWTDEMHDHDLADVIRGLR